MRCPECGKEISLDKKFCMFCGAPVQRSVKKIDPVKDESPTQELPKVDPANRCPHCSTLVKEGSAFCPICGYQMNEKKAEPRRDTPRQEERVFDEPRRDPIAPKQPRRNKPKGPKKSNFLIGDGDGAVSPNKIGIIATIVGLIVAIIILLIVAVGLINKDKHDNSTADFTSSTIPSENNNSSDLQFEQPEVQEKTEEAEEAQEPESPDTSAADAENVRTIVVSYMNDFVDDVNDGAYRNMYDSVASGSKMEADQQKFVSNSNYYEELMDYSIKSNERINDTTYHTTTVEKYDITNYNNGSSYYLQQQCTYEVKKQSNESWQITELLSIDVIDKTEY